MAGSVLVDPLDTDAIARVAGGARAIVHLAGKAHAMRPDAAAEAAFVQANVEHAACVARAAARTGATLVLVSSAGVLGKSSPPAGFGDDAVPAPYDAYTRSKLAAELQVRAIADETGLALVIVRPPMVVGPMAPGNFGRLLRLAGSVPLPLRSLTARRSVVGARNLADFLLHCATDPRARAATMLVAEPHALTVSQMVEAVTVASGRPSRLFSVPSGLIRLGLRASRREADLVRLFENFVLRPTEGSARLGWRPPHSTAEELAWASGQA